jgi:hypothetical protein
MAVAVPAAADLDKRAFCRSGTLVLAAKHPLIKGFDRTQRWG